MLNGVSFLLNLVTEFGHEKVSFYFRNNPEVSINGQLSGDDADRIYRGVRECQ